MRNTWQAGVLAGAWLAGGTAQAAGFALMEQGASGLGSAYAGAAVAAEDASTVFFNPAGIAALDRREFAAALVAVAPAARFQDGGSQAAALQARGGEGGDAGGVAPLPSLYYTQPLGGRWRLGVALNVPFGLSTEYDPDWVGRFQAVKSELATVNLNPSLALKLNEAWSLGAGLNYQRAEAELSHNVNYSAAAFAAGGPALLGAVGGPGREGRVTFEGDDGAWGYNVGLRYAPGSTRLGAAYRSRLKYTLTGDARFAERPAALAAGLPDGPVEARLTVPDSLALAASHDFGRVELLADATWTHWSVFDTLRVTRASGAVLTDQPQRWDDVWRLAVGAKFAAGPAWTWRVGVAWDESPVPDEYRNARVPDADRVWLAVGGRYRWSSAGALDVGYARLITGDAPIHQDQTASGGGRLQGEYDNHADVLGVQLSYGF